MYQKKFEELELRDDFIFGKVMRNKAICKKTLEILLGIQIEDIEYPETQKCSRKAMRRIFVNCLNGAVTIKV